jgi:hypothetical protein
MYSLSLSHKHTRARAAHTHTHTHTHTHSVRVPKATVQAVMGGEAFAYVQDLLALYPEDQRLRDALRAASVMQTSGMC